MSVATGQAAEVTHWRNAVVAAYAFSGIAFAVWVSLLAVMVMLVVSFLLSPVAWKIG